MPMNDSIPQYYSYSKAFDPFDQNSGISSLKNQRVSMARHCLSPQGHCQTRESRRGRSWNQDIQHLHWGQDTSIRYRFHFNSRNPRNINILCPCVPYISSYCHMLVLDEHINELSRHMIGIIAWLGTPGCRVDLYNLGWSPTWGIN